MAPIDDPELIVYLAIKQPKLKGDEYGAQPLAEIFKPVIKNSLEYLKVKPYTEKQIADAAKQSQLKSTKLCKSIDGYNREKCRKREATAGNFRRRKNNKTISTVWRGNE